jgi:hypothetical protein
MQNEAVVIYFQVLLRLRPEMLWNYLKISNTKPVIPQTSSNLFMFFDYGDEACNSLTVESFIIKNDLSSAQWKFRTMHLL